MERSANTRWRRSQTIALHPLRHSRLVFDRRAQDDSAVLDTERAVELGESFRKGIDVAPEASIPVDAPSAAVVPSEGTPAATDSDSGGGQGSSGNSDNA